MTSILIFPFLCKFLLQQILSFHLIYLVVELKLVVVVMVRGDLDVVVDVLFLQYVPMVAVVVAVVLVVADAE